MLHVSEKPALSDTDYTDYMLNYSGLTQDNNLYFDETGNYKKKSYDLLNTIQRNHLKVQISTIDPLLIQKSKSSFSNLIRDGPVSFLSWHRDTAQIITHPLYYYSAV